MTATPCLVFGSHHGGPYHLTVPLNVPCEEVHHHRTFPPVRLYVDMAFDWLRFARPVPTRDVRGHNNLQRPPPMIARVHGKRPIAPPVVPQVRRLHHRNPHPHRSPSAPVSRAPTPGRRGPVVRAPARPLARPHPPQRGSKLLQCLHFHFHPSQKRDAALAVPRSVKYMSSQQVPPFPPPRGAVRPPRRHVHWAPAQAPLPQQPYPYPSHNSSGSSQSQVRSHHYHVPTAIPRYQPPRENRGPPHAPQKRK